MIAFIPGLLILVGVVAVFERATAHRGAKLARLISRYNSAETAARLFRGDIWQGQTAKQLLDSRGEPAARLRSAAPQTEVWIYSRRALNCGFLQVTLADGIVVAWLTGSRDPSRKIVRRPPRKPTLRCIGLSRDG